MKSYFFSIVIGGLLLIVLLQGVLFASTGLQSQNLQKQIKEVTKKLDVLQEKTDASFNSLTQLKNDNNLATNEKTTLDQILSLSDSDPNNVLSPANLSQTLGAETTTIANTITKTLTLKPNWKTVDTYEAAKTSSRVIGQVLSNKEYPIVSKQTNWYQIKFDPLTNSWVQAQFVNETN